MNKKIEKLIKYELNLDYPRYEISLEKQTNQLINLLMNRFVIQYEEDFKSKYVVLEFQNDAISLIAYSILKNMQTIKPFNLLIYGRTSLLRKYLKGKHKEKKISRRTLNKLMKVDKVIYVSCFHPIYQVVNSKRTFNFFTNRFNLLEKFTPSELKMGLIFYNIIRNKRDRKLFKSQNFIDFDNFCNGEHVDNKEIEKLLTLESIPTIRIIKITGDFQKDNKLINDIVHMNDLIFYHCDINKPLTDYQILFSSYQYFLENKANIPNIENNINRYELVQQLHEEEGSVVVFVGDFTEAEEILWLGGKI